MKIARPKHPVITQKENTILSDIETNLKKYTKKSKKTIGLPWRKAKEVRIHPEAAEEKKDDSDKKSSRKNLFNFKPKRSAQNTIEEILKEYTDLYQVPLPDLSDDEIDWVVERYWLKAPFSYAKIVRNWELDLTYTVIEPKINEKELIVLEETYEYLRSVLVYDSPVKRGDLNLDPHFVRRVIRSFDPTISNERTEILLYYLQRNFTGYSKLDPLMNDESIEDITCNGSNIPLFIYHSKYSNLETNLIFDDVELNKYVLKLAQKADKQLSLTTPLIDAALPGGARAQITYSDIISSKGSSFTIRKFKKEPMTPVDLINIGTYSSELMAFLWLAVENNKSMIVVGGTASGKTSTMNAVSFFIPPVAKIVSIEDTREIQLPHSNWLAMKTRESGITSVKGDVGMFTLLKAALRQRPEYIIVGEVRGAEAQTLFQAMNSGHTTYSTLHAGGVGEAINRLTHEPINVPKVMFGALNLMLIQGLQYKEGHGFRRCMSINEMIVKEGSISWNELFTWNHITDTFVRNPVKSQTLDDIAYSHGWDKEKLEYNIYIRKNMLERLAEKKIHDSLQISHFINELRKSCNH